MEGGAIVGTGLQQLNLLLCFNGLDLKNSGRFGELIAHVAGQRAGMIRSGILGGVLCTQFLITTIQTEERLRLPANRANHNVSFTNGA